MAQPLLLPGWRAPMRVAEYVRMSTDRQAYSVANQTSAIERYAASHHMVVVRRYHDLGKSGQSIDGRDALQQLLTDIQAPRPAFEAVLVLDISRWGRFQNTDEAGFYEFLCWKRGIRVCYVGEPFANDGEPFSMVFKGLKRVMATEYARELSARVIAGQRRWASQGYRQGAPAGLGLRRQAVSHEGKTRVIMARGERKRVGTDRVVLVHGPDHELQTIRWMFEQYLAGNGDSAIARQLNDRGCLTQAGKRWSATTVRAVLRAERYAGCNIYRPAKTSLAALRSPAAVPAAVRRTDAFPAIVSPAVFAAAQARRRCAPCHASKTDLVERTRALWVRQGTLNASLLNAEPSLPSSFTLARRFGSLAALYREVSAVPDHGPRPMKTRQRIHRWRQSLTAFAHRLLIKHGSAVERDGWGLRIDGRWSVSFTVLHSSKRGGQGCTWFNRGASEATDLVVFARLGAGEAGPLDYTVLPRQLFPHWPDFFDDRVRPWVDGFRYPSLAILLDMARASRGNVP